MLDIFKLNNNFINIFTFAPNLPMIVMNVFASSLHLKENLLKFVIFTLT